MYHGDRKDIFFVLECPDPDVKEDDVVEDVGKWEPYAGLGHN